MTEYAHGACPKCGAAVRRPADTEGWELVMCNVCHDTFASRVVGRLRNQLETTNMIRDLDEEGRTIFVSSFIDRKLIIRVAWIAVTGAIVVWLLSRYG